MLPILTLLITLAIALVVTRVATVALTLTGLSKESARFQARSAYTGVGFTTTEAESVVGHPVRRRIVMILMLLGNAGLVTVVASLMLSFIGNSNRGPVWLVPVSLILGITLLLLAASSKWLERRMSTVIERSLRKWTDLQTQDYENLLRLSEGFGVGEVLIEAGDHMFGKSLAELKLKQNGILVLGIQRADGAYIGGPSGGTQFQANDVAIVYGKGEKIVSVCGKTAQR